MSEQTSIEITLDDGTMLLVAEILRHERGQQKLDGDAATEAVLAALQRLSNFDPEEHFPCPNKSP